MKIDWKELAKSQVYKDLKQTLIDANNQCNTNNQIGKSSYNMGKSNYIYNFNLIVGRAKHIAHHKSISLVEALELMKKAGGNYLSVKNINCIYNRLDKNNPLCWQQKLLKNYARFKRESRRKYPKHRWAKEYKKGGKYYGLS